jgi:predicted alpha/beta superfamily hydrolase
MLTVKKRMVCYFMSLAGILIPLCGQEESPRIINYRIGHYETFRSKILNEERKILVHLPKDYGTSSKTYPVLFVLDAEGTHRYIQAITAIAFYSGVRRLPKMIVVGILNTDRIRDITPRKIEQYEHSGGGDTFLEFIAAELIPYIKSKYRSAQYRILFGGSSAGMFTLYTLFNSPELFNAYIASRPALNSTDDYTWDSEVILRKARNLFAGNSSLKKIVCIDYGGHEDALHDPKPIHELSTIFKIGAPEDFRWKIREIHESGYRSAESLKDGLLSIFNGWYYPADSLYAHGFYGIENHANRLIEGFGYPISVADLLAERDMLMFGHRFLENNNTKEALALFNYAVTAYSNSWNAFDSLADAYMKNGQVDLAVENYERSLKLNPNNNNAREKLKQIISQADISPQFKGKYLGQKPPGPLAIKFNKGMLIGDKNSFNVSFSPDMKELFFSHYKGTPECPHPEYEICYFRQVGGIWYGPEIAFFSGKYSDVDVTFSPDGKKLFFTSDRPHPKSADMDIYYLEKKEKRWSQPIYAGTEVNTIHNEVHAVLSSKGNLFFASNRPGGFGDKDLYRAEWIGGKFTNVTNLGPEVNSAYLDSDCFIVQDESYIVFDSIRPEDGGQPQIYVSFQTGDNQWTKAVNIGEMVNTKDGSSAPTLSPDGKYLFFKRRRGKDRGIHWISTEIIANLKKEILNLKSLN